MRQNEKLARRGIDLEAQSRYQGFQDALYYAGLKEIVNSQRKIPENS